MKWYKFYTDTMRKANVERLIMEYGMDGYGLYCACMELISGEIAIDNLTFELNHDAELIAHRFKMDTLKVEKIMHRCIELGLFDLADSGKLRCLQLAKMLDESISKNPYVKDMKKKISEIPETFRNPSGVVPTRVDKIRLDQIRPDKTIEEKPKKPTPPKEDIPPDKSDLQSYITNNSYNVNPDRFYDFYESKGWLVGKSKMKSWKAAVRNWNYKESNPAPMTRKEIEKAEEQKRIDAIVKAGTEKMRRQEEERKLKETGVKIGL